MANRIDNFTRVDNALTLGTPSSGGSNWIAETGDAWGIDQNEAYHVGGTFPSIVTLEASASDVDVEVTIPTVAGAFGPIIRVSDSLSYILLYSDGSQIAFVKFNSGSASNLDVFSIATVAGDILRIHAVGSSLEGYHNGILRLNATETFNQAETRHGLFNDSNSGTRYADFSITEIGGDPTTATVSGPSTGVISAESTVFTITLNSASIGTTTVNLASNDAGDVFRATSGGSTVTSITIADGQTVGTFYLFPDTTVGARTLTPTAIGITFTPTTLTYTTTPPALIAGMASFVSSGPGGITVFATDATGGTGTKTYQWQRNENEGSYSNMNDGDNVDGSTTLMIIDSSTEEGKLYFYRIVYTDSAMETDTSNSVPAEIYTGGPIGSGNSYPRSRIVNG